MNRRAIALLCALLIAPALLFAQWTKPTNVYPSNLDTNMYFDKYDDATKVISGINFMVLADGSNSTDKTDPFKIKLYLLVPGGDTPIFIKTYATQGINHMGSLEYRDESVDLSTVPGLTTGKYRLGVYADADNEIKGPDQGNRAMLFKGEIDFTATNARGSQPDTEDSLGAPPGFGSPDFSFPSD